MPLIAYRPSSDLIGLVEILDGKWSGYRALCRCPAHADGTPSLSVRQGDRGILVKCFAGCHTSDVLRALARVAKIPRSAAPDPTDFENRSSTRNVERLWREAYGVSGTLAAKYLAHRQIAAAFADLRYHPRCPKGPRPATVFKPALLVAVRTDRALTALQRIFLEPDGSYSEKLMIGRPGVASWRGTRPINGRLAIAEGFETAARFTMRTQIPCWASLGAARLPLIALPDDLTELIIAEDDDPEGARAAKRTIVAYQRPGLIIERMPPPRPAGLRGRNDWARLDAR